jgi:hypothetical protein
MGARNFVRFSAEKRVVPSLDTLVHRAASGYAAWASHTKRNVGDPAKPGGSMNDTNPENPEDQAFRLSVGDPRSCQATIIKVADGYTVTVSLKEDGRTRGVAESTVDTYSDAEAVAKAFASQQEFPWYKVAIVSK